VTSPTFNSSSHHIFWSLTRWGAVDGDARAETNERTSRGIWNSSIVGSAGQSQSSDLGRITHRLSRLFRRMRRSSHTSAGRKTVLCFSLPEHNTLSFAILATGSLTCAVGFGLIHEMIFLVPGFQYPGLLSVLTMLTHFFLWFN